MPTKTDSAPLSLEPEYLLETDLAVWPAARKRYDALNSVRHRHLQLGGRNWHLMFNPDRAVSTCARTDAASIAARPCFLCNANRPAEQCAHRLTADFDLLVNPFPIFNPHFTIVSRHHEPQILTPANLTQFVEAIEILPLDYVTFYNGAHSGASAPDHMHFQATLRRHLPLLSTNDVRYKLLREMNDAAVLTAPEALGRPMAITTKRPDSLPRLIAELLMTLPVLPGESEPRINMFGTRQADGTYTVTFTPRTAHRPACYGDDGVLFSPGAVDMAGGIVLPREADFDSITVEKLEAMLREVTLGTDDYNSTILNIISHDFS